MGMLETVRATDLVEWERICVFKDPKKSRLQIFEIILDLKIYLNF